ncbi:MAG TPA: OsmC family protein [Thermoanaerobaculia bacterium]
MKITFPGGLRVDALHDGIRIRTDQPVAKGGGGSAPSPFELFLASIGTCAGFYALGFCRQRGVDVTEMELTLEPVWDATRKHVDRIRLEVDLPPDFPEKYRDAIGRAIDQCAVKRHLEAPPQFDVTLRRHRTPVLLAQDLLAGPTPPPC